MENNPTPPYKKLMQAPTQQEINRYSTWEETRSEETRSEETRSEETRSEETRREGEKDCEGERCGFDVVGRMSQRYWDEHYGLVPAEDSQDLLKTRSEEVWIVLDRRRLGDHYDLSHPLRCRWLWIWLGLGDKRQWPRTYIWAEILYVVWREPYFYPFMDAPESVHTLHKQYSLTGYRKCLLRLSSTKPGALTLTYWKRDEQPGASTTGQEIPTLKKQRIDWQVKHYRLYITETGQLSFASGCIVSSGRENCLETLREMVATKEVLEDGF
jgi:hypothetical protein